ncbi:unnamed protein product [Rotaria socialis]|uniref:Multifunctional fusion protein n=1 Tax=Rotaria socialis TaxID=392032 RepID=A0A817TIQ9_9BILA|nr:unnamed protein product [Rotaria socialis]CAF3460226.1 unnamed protein product [Rotaria socialis]CAF4458948.1 unnamed protein product [Rotaria socialis]CAF4820431.1 unnamed protein product [Rotaria socialis]
MSGTNPKPTVPNSTASAATSIITISDATQPRRQMVQDYLVIWVDGNIDESHEDCQNTLAQLRATVSEVNVFRTPEECIEFLNKIDEGKAFVISSGALGRSLIHDIHGMPKVNAIYIFCDKKARHEPWAKDWSKIRGVFTSIKPICESLKKVARECDHDSIPMSFIPKQCASDAASNEQNLNQLPPTYMYSVILKGIILEIDDDDTKSIKALEVYCKKQNIPDAEINELKCKYHQKSPVWWYTCDMFLYGMLNRGLRSLDMKAMSKLGFFIRSLHLQLKQLHQEQATNFQKPFTVYRGQGMNKEDFQNLLDSKGGLLSFNNFLSTSMDQKVTTSFVQGALQKNEDVVGVIFIMKIDPSRMSSSITPFAMIHDHSAVPSEQEILFTMHTVFRVAEIKQMATNSRLWKVQLTITDDNDPQLSALTNRIKEEISGRGWQRMGQLMLTVGHLDQAEELYNELLENASNDSDKVHIYDQLGWLKDNQGKYPEALEFYGKGLEITKNTLPPNHPKLATSYNNIGLVYRNMGEYSKALEVYEKSLKIKEISLPPNHPSLATSYNNIGSVYNSMGEYSKAFEVYEKSLKIKEISLSPNHPSLATSYNNIGSVYNSMGEYSKALSYLEKALSIKQKSLHSTHPSIKNVMTSIAAVKKKL